MNDNADLRKYRIELPNLIDDLDLSVYAFRLYVHIKRVSGANGGSCHQGTRKLAEACHMSIGQVSAAKKELLDKGLITKTTRPSNGGTVDDLAPVDIWQRNYDTYSKGVHTVNTIEPETGKGVHTVNEGVQVVNTGVHTVNERKNQLRKNQEERDGERAKKRAPPPPKQASMSSFNEAVQVYKELSGVKTIAPSTADKIADTVTDIPFWRKVVPAWIGAGYNPKRTDGMLDWYEHPEQMDRRNGHRNGKHIRQTTEQHFERAQWRESTDDEPA